jgi:AcrR family transcriptional regulator
VPRPSYDKVDPEKKAKLIAAATREFAAHGYELASINQIIEDAGLSKGSVYYYFEDKLDLAATVYLEVGIPMASVGEFRLPHTVDEFWVELRRISMERLRDMVSQRDSYECMLRLSNALLKDEKLRARVMPMFEPSRQKMMGFLEQGVAIGAMRSDLPLPTLTALIEGAKTAAYKSLYPGDPVLTEAEMESFTDLVIDLAKRLTSPAKG